MKTESTECQFTFIATVYGKSNAYTQLQRRRKNHNRFCLLTMFIVYTEKLALNIYDDPIFEGYDNGIPLHNKHN